MQKFLVIKNKSEYFKICKVKPKYRILEGLAWFFYSAEYRVPVQIVHFRLFLYINISIFRGGNIVHLLFSLYITTKNL